MRRTGPGIVVALAALIGPAGAAEAAEHYFGLVFGSQSHPKRLRDTHTWATFVRAVGEGPDPGGYQLFVHTISWLPRTLEVKVWRPWPEPGVNLDLDATLRTVLAGDQRVTLWGPFLITPEVYWRSLRVKHVLESGAAEYRAISTRYDLLVADCIHAVAAADPVFGRDHYPLIRVGVPASRFLAREVMVRSREDQGIDQRAFDHRWLLPRLGLDRYPIAVIPPQQIPLRSCVFCRCPP